MHVRLIIPGIPDPCSDYLTRVVNIAGGFTTWQGIGGWKDGQGRLIIEPITIVEISFDSGGGLSDEVAADRFRHLATDIAKDLRQDCVYLAIDNVVEYVKG
jgi:hypothetical protein